MMTWLSDPQAWIALGTLTALEIVLGIDNIIFNLKMRRAPREPVQLRKSIPTDKLA